MKNLILRGKGRVRNKTIKSINKTKHGKVRVSPLCPSFLKYLLICIFHYLPNGLYKWDKENKK